ncbi:tetratricopeptide repeat protein [Rhodoplanes sp. SY1]|uniref:tetratricopeptide repeat protein n=1 Tax=Rhodoplanes sp. SY1 TaxID=3166646 RepID=UPI0038B4873F
MARSVDDTFRRAVDALQAGRVSDAERAFRKVLEAAPRHPGALNLFTVLLMRLGRWAEAEPYARRAARETAGSDVTLYNFGLILKQVGKPAEALEPLGRALALNPRVPDTLITRAGVLRDLGRYDEALADADAALALAPASIDPLVVRASVLGALRRFDEALAAYEKAAAQAPDRPEPWLGCGKTLASLNRQDAALAAFDRALALRPDSAEALQGRGMTLAALGRFAEALAAYDEVLARNPALPDAWIGLGDVFFRQGRHDRAVAAYDRAIALDATAARALLHRAKARMVLDRLAEAEADCARARALAPTAEAWQLAAEIAYYLKRYDESLRFYDNALAAGAGPDYLAGGRLHTKLQVCDWAGLDEDVERLRAAVGRGEPVVQPFVGLFLPFSADEQLRCAGIFVSRLEAPRLPPVDPATRRHDRIRLAYFSADLREHPTAHLISGLFEHHDRTRFETTVIVWGERAGSAFAARIDAAVDHVVDVSAMSDAEVADLVRAREIDILVDLMGLTRNCRFPVLARRPAPIQVNYLGYPGTVGSDCVDYILADGVTVPDALRGGFAEHVVRLPHSYQVNDDRRAVAAEVPTRAACGLPDDAFVFCCFNNSFKIQPADFAVWMQLLGQVEGSVLWLLDENPLARANLRREAQVRGIDPDRLVFAPRCPLPEHLARHRLADLFVDTLPYNAHTTASDALWGGLPVVTCEGETFAGRVCASLLRAVGLPELVTGSLADYEATALALAHDPARLAALRARLAENRTTAPLFDTARFARDVETAFAVMWRRWKAGEKPAEFSVDDNRPAD